MLTITNKTQNLKIERAIRIVTKHYTDEAFFQRFNEVKFSCGSTYSTIIAQITHEHAPLTIDYYRPWWRFSKAVARYTRDNTILFNKYIITDLEVSDLIETVFHEVCHHWGFTHITNYRTSHNLETVPYKLSNVFKQYIFTYYPNEL